MGWGGHDEVGREEMVGLERGGVDEGGREGGRKE